MNFLFLSLLLSVTVCALEAGENIETSNTIDIEVFTKDAVSMGTRVVKNDRNFKIKVAPQKGWPGVRFNFAPQNWSDFRYFFIEIEMDPFVRSTGWGMEIITQSGQTANQYLHSQIKGNGWKKVFFDLEAFADKEFDNVTAVKLFFKAPQEPFVFSIRQAGFTQFSENTWQGPVSNEQILLVDSADPESINLNAWSVTSDSKIGKAIKDSKACIYFDTVFYGEGWPGVSLNLDGMDLSGYHELSGYALVQSNLSAAPTLNVELKNNGATAKAFGNSAASSYWLENGKWVRFTWDFSMYPRDKMTMIRLLSKDNGTLPGESSNIRMYLTDLKIRRKEKPNKYAGWEIEEGIIAFSHLGYRPFSQKIALADPKTIDSSEFKIIDVSNNNVEITKKWQKINTRLGKYYLADFSELSQQGVYILESGDVKSQSFAVSLSPYSEVEEALIKEFFFERRCGCETNTHGICHLDDAMLSKKNVHQSMVGGWHDAGDARKYTENNALPLSAILYYINRIERGTQNLVTVERARQEALWGNGFSLNSVDKYGRVMNQIAGDHWTDNIIGSQDDRELNESTHHVLAALAVTVSQAQMAALTKESDPAYSKECLEAAQKMYRFIMDDDYRHQSVLAKNLQHEKVLETYDNKMYQHSGYYVIAAMELFNASNKDNYRQDAIESAKKLLSEFDSDLSWNDSGFIRSWKLGAKYNYGPRLALKMLLDKFPDHPDWLKWYSAIRYDSELFLKPASSFNYPFLLSPKGFVDEETAQRAAVTSYTRWTAYNLEKMPKIGNLYLRTFNTFYSPVMNFLNRIAGMGEGMNVSDDIELEQIAHRNLQWFFGLNPFGRTLVTKMGYRSHDTVSRFDGVPRGTIYGMNGQANGDDIPVYYENTFYPWKEPWTIVGGQLLWAASCLNQPAILNLRVLNYPGDSRQLRIRHKETGKIVSMLSPDRYNKYGPEQLQGGAQYVLELGDFRYNLKAVSGKKYEIDWDLTKSIELAIEADKRLSSGKNEILRLKLNNTGSKKNVFDIRLFGENLELNTHRVQVELDKSQSVTKEILVNVKDADKPAMLLAVSGDNSKLMTDWVGYCSKEMEEAK